MTMIIMWVLCGLINCWIMIDITTKDKDVTVEDIPLLICMMGIGFIGLLSIVVAAVIYGLGIFSSNRVLFRKKESKE